MRDDGENVVAHLNFLSKTLLGRENEGPAVFFLELPRGMNVTFNGRTYTNDPAPNDAKVELYPDAQVGHSPFYIGTRHDYTVIELLSQPIIFSGTSKI